MKSPTAFLPLCLSILPILPCESDAATNLIQNGSFETPDMPTGAHYHLPLGSLGAWQTITTDSFEIWSNPTPGSAAYDGKQHLELQDAPDAVFQTIATTVGREYTLIFYHSPRPGVDSLLTVALNSITVGTLQELGSNQTTFAWQEFRTSFEATAAFTTLSFTDATTLSGYGSHIDAVQVYAIPESSAGVLLLGTAALLMRRKRCEENNGNPTEAASGRAVRRISYLSASLLRP